MGVSVLKMCCSDCNYSIAPVSHSFSDCLVSPPVKEMNVPNTLWSFSPVARPGCRWSCWKSSLSGPQRVPGCPLSSCSPVLIAGEPGSHFTHSKCSSFSPSLPGSVTVGLRFDWTFTSTAPPTLAASSPRKVSSDAKYYWWQTQSY